MKLNSPVYGVIFLFKYPTGDASQSRETPRDGVFDFDAAQNLFFAGQTIQNACGTQALLSVLLNQESKVEIGLKLKEFKDFTGAFPSDVRAANLRNIGSVVNFGRRSCEARHSRTLNLSETYTTHLLVRLLSSTKHSDYGRKMMTSIISLHILLSMAYFTSLMVFSPRPSHTVAAAFKNSRSRSYRFCNVGLKGTRQTRYDSTC